MGVELSKLELFQSIPFQWGETDPKRGLDCFTLASYVSESLFNVTFDTALRPIRMAYKNYNNISAFPANAVSLIADELKLEDVSDRYDGTLVMLQDHKGRVCLSTSVGNYLIFMGENGSAVKPINIFEGQQIVRMVSPMNLWRNSNSTN